MGSGTEIPSDRMRSPLRNKVLLRHCWPGTLQSPNVSPNAISTWSFAPVWPLSHTIPRSAPEMAKRAYVLFGLLGPFTQLTIAVVGAGIAAAGLGTVPAALGPGMTGLVALGTSWAAAPGGTGQGNTAPSCCIGAKFSPPVAAGFEAAAGSGPSWGGDAWFCAPRGIRPVGT